MNCIKSDFDTVWPLYGEAITMPTFDAKEFARIKQDAINNLKANEAQPDAAIDKYADKVAFAGRDYAKDPAGTVDIIQKLTPEETKAYYQSVLTRSRMLVIVVAADLDRTVIERKVSKLAGRYKTGCTLRFEKIVLQGI